MTDEMQAGGWGENGFATREDAEEYAAVILSWNDGGSVYVEWNDREERWSVVRYYEGEPLPPTKGVWVADVAKRGSIARDGSTLGWFEMFPDDKGRLFSVPDSSRYIHNPAQRDRR